MRILKHSIITMIALLLISCGNDSANEGEINSTDTEAKANEICTYRYDDTAKTELKWTAYKTTAKIGVGGQFQTVHISGSTTSEDIPTMMKNAMIHIPVAGTITGDEARDKKIIEFFFGAMIDSENIMGSVTTVEGDNTGGKCMLAIKMNGIKEVLDMTYRVEGSMLTMEGSLNLNGWNGSAAIANLNKNCNEKHTGEDGVTKLWPEVGISFSTVLKKECK